jgi:hypothetical protein
MTGAAPVPVPPAHAGRHEHHVRSLEPLGDHFARFFGRLLADLGIGACAEAARQLLADLQLLLGLRLLKRLRIRIDRDELDAAHAGLNHPVDRVAAAAAHADHLDRRQRFHFHIEFQHE